MCLIVNKKQCPNGYKIAKKNIPCYKVLLKRCDGAFETPFRKQIVDITTGIEADKFQTKPMHSIIMSDLLIWRGIHSHTNLASAHKTQNTYFIGLNIYIHVGVVVLKAYIPKGTKYWVGKDHDFCSERIVFAEK